MTNQKKLKVIEEAFNYYHDRNSLTSKDEKELLNLVNELYEAISVTRCSAQLKDKKTITINKWTEDNGYKHSFTDCYIKGDDWFTGKQMWQKYNEAMKNL